jgi:hypothetical protein
VEPLLARVRWNKDAGAQTAFTHMALRVSWPVCTVASVCMLLLSPSSAADAAAG